ncbi:hypothetical protein Acr_00g0032090 [Actinidia rufa]|uniref:RNase H type-1 domain-containing protein n=1 Tax=Actinidia rufa TaxID=165716 RepID=A0A7J0DFB1_9ERIC|nr:hypothetical protein Acr_00g0032090 [Actinidia rufa]
MGYPMFAHKSDESLARTSTTADRTIEVLEVHKEPPQVKTTPTADDFNEGPEALLKPPQIDQTKAWKMYVVGAKTSLGVGAGVVLKSPEGTFFEYYLKQNFSTTNNKAKDETFIAGLRSANKLMVPELHIFYDSNMVVN